MCFAGKDFVLEVKWQEKVFVPMTGLHDPASCICSSQAENRRGNPGDTLDVSFWRHADLPPCECLESEIENCGVGKSYLGVSMLHRFEFEDHIIHIQPSGSEGRV